MKKTTWFQALFFTSLLIPSCYSQASTLLVDSGIGASTNTRATNFNPNFGNGILAEIKVGGTPVAIDQFALYGKQETDGNLRFSIFDGSSGVFATNGTATPNLTRVYDSGIVSTAAGSSLGWILSPSFSLTLDANKTYYVGIISDQSFTYTYNLPASAVDFGLGLSMPEATGASTDRGRNGNFGNFADPTFTRTAWAQISARVYGTPATVPLPSAVWLFGSALIGLSIKGRRKPL